MVKVASYKVVQNVRNTASVIESAIDLDGLSAQYRKTLCGCDPLARVYDDNGRSIVDYVFYERHGNGPFTECPDPRLYLDSFDNPFVGNIEHVCPSHRQCLIERSGQIDECEEE